MGKKTGIQKDEITRALEGKKSSSGVCKPQIPANMKQNQVQTSILSINKSKKTYDFHILN